MLESPQGVHISVAGKPVVNLCANNYLGLADDPRIVEAAKAALDRYGYGMASVRFICGTETVHTEPRAPALGLPGDGSDDPLLVLFRRERRPF